MDYQEAKRIRKTGLLSLATKHMFEEGKGIGGSLGSAISDKFKAKAKGIQESLDPLNWVRKMTGEGFVGDLAVSGLGRLFRRSNKSITNFGGYARKTSKRAKSPNITKVSEGPIKPLKVKDSTADILGKMYNFMRRTDEAHTRYDEVEKSFRQEQMDEDERRHKELVKAIKEYKKGGTGKKPDEKDSDKESDNSSIIKDLAIGLAALKGLKLAKTLIKGGAKTAYKTAAKVLEKTGAKAAYKKIATKVTTKVGDTLGSKLGGKFGAKILSKYSGVMTASEIMGKSLTKKEIAKLAKEGIKYSAKAGQFFKEGVKGSIKAEVAAEVIGRKVIKKVSKEALAKSVTKVVAKRGLGSIIKKIPIIGLGAGLYFGIDRAIAGDFSGAGAEVASGLMGGSAIGIAGSVATDVGLAARDVYIDNYKTKPEDDEPELVKERFSEILEAVKKEIGDMPKSFEESITPKLTPKNQLKDTTIPTPLSEDTTTNSNQSVVTTNNTVNNIGGSKPKVLQTELASQRNKDIYRQLLNSITPV